MQDVGKELPGLIRALLQSPADRQRQLIEAHYTPDCRLTHALVMGQCREDIVRIFQAWRFLNRRLDVEVHEIVLDAGGRKVWVQFVQHVTGYCHYLAPPWSFSLPMSALLYLREGPGGTKLICKQVDFHSFEGILYTAPGLGWLMQYAFRRLGSACLIRGARLAAGLWPPLEAWLCGSLVRRRRMEALKAWAAGAWWRQAPPALWTVPPPYDPRL